MWLKRFWVQRYGEMSKRAIPKNCGLWQDEHQRLIELC